MKINGSLVFDASSASEIQNLRIQKVAGLPTHGTADVGRLIYVTTNHTIYFGGQSSWIAIATGGNAAALQDEVDAIETSLGAGVNANGTFNADAFNGEGPLTNVTSFTNAITQLAAYATANDTLAELDDVSLVSAAVGDFLRYNGTAWTDSTIDLSTDLGITVTAATINQLGNATFTAADLDKLSDVTASAAELNVLDGIPATLTAIELGYVDGVTSPIQDQLDSLQLEDATLTALAGLNGDAGIVVQTGVDAFTKRSLVAPAAGITITNPAGTAGDFTFALANDLAALEGLTGNGYVVRTGDGTAVTRAISGQTGRIVVTNGDGVASNTDIDLATLTDSGTGTFLKFTRDTYGRVSGTAAVVASDITGLVDATYVNVAGDTMTGNLEMAAGFHVVLNTAPSSGTHAVNKNYVDSLVDGLTWKNAVRAATTADITLTGEQTIDGVAVVAGDRVLVKNQTIPAQNGIYVVSASNWSRAADMDAASEFYHAAVFVTEGSANANTGWTETSIVTTVGNSPVTWQQFSGANTYVAGTGLDLAGNTFNINLGAGIFEGPSDAVGIDLHSPTAGALILTDDGSTRASPLALNSKLHLLIPAGAGLTQDATGLYIPAAGVTNAMLANSTVGLNADAGGPTTLALGQTLLVAGTSTQGINTSVSGQTVTITAVDASASQKGVARFDATEFTVTAGTVALGTIPLGKLANSTITVTGTTGSDAVALGESLAIIGGAGGEVSTAMGTNSLEISVRDATASLKGVASFDGGHFSVTAGAVSLAASLDDLTNVSSADNATTGDLLTKTAGDWQPISRTALAGTINLGDLQDVGTAPATTAGDALIADGTSWQAKKIYHLHTQTTAATSWTVTHGIGQRYCNVTIVDADHEVVIPQSITFNSTTQLTVTFNTAVAGFVVVMGV